MSESDGQLPGRRIIITGAASGMGHAIARLFRRQGAATALLDVDAAGLSQIEGDGTIAIPTDISSPDAVGEAVERAAGAMGGIDGIVNAAGILRVYPFADTSLELWRRVQDVNLLGPYLLCHAALPHLQAADKATIVNISSLAGLSAPVGMSAYAASKAGLIGLTKVLAAELGPRIRANAIAPGITRTQMTADLWKEDPEGADKASLHLALKRPGEPEEIAQVALFLTSEQSSFITGVVTAVDGGSSWH